MWRKMQFTSNIMAATIQNISKQKAGTSTPAITATDLQNAMRLSFLTIYPGNTMVPTSNSYAPVGYSPHIFLYYIQGTGTNQAQIKWIRCEYYWNAYPEGNSANRQYDRSAVKYASGTASNIYPMLAINSGETKMLLECFVYYPTNQDYYFSPNHPLYAKKCTRNISPRQAFGFLMLNPKHHDTTTRWISNFFYGVTIFTPIGSAFSETAPK